MLTYTTLTFKMPCVTAFSFLIAVEYMAPEVVTRAPGYSKPADWWSFGIFTFDLLTGRSPFHSNRGKQETKERILRGKFHTPAFLTPNAQDLIRRLLRRPVDRRLGSKGGAAEVKAHGFFGDIDWDKVIRRQYQPPFVPTLSSDDDVSNFDTRFTSKSPRESDDTPVKKNGTDEADGKFNLLSMTLMTSGFTMIVFCSGTDEEKYHMFEGFDYISPEMIASRASSELPAPSEELRDLRIHGFGP